MRIGPAPLGALSMVLATAVAALTATAAETSRDYNWSGALAAGTTLKIGDINGRITVTRSSGRDASVKARIHSDSGADLKDIDVSWNNDRHTHEAVDFTVGLPDGLPLDEGALDFKTVNGSVTLQLPKKSGFALNAKTVNGSIDAGAFGLQETGVHFVGHSLQGKAGNGGAELNVKTGNGSIRIGSV